MRRSSQERQLLVPSRGELRFEAIYYGVTAAFALAVIWARFRWDAPHAGVALLVTLATLGLAFSLSVGPRVARGDVPQLPRKATVAEGRALRERTQRWMPLLILLALLVVATGRAPATVAAACLCGWALASLAGFLHVRAWESRTGRRAVNGGGRTYAGARQVR